MFKVLGLALCFVSLASAGYGWNPLSVNPVEECEQTSGDFHDLRVTDCNDTPCIVYVGREYLTEVDFTPSHDSQELTIKMSMILPGIELVILETPVGGSEVIGGEGYTFRYVLTPAGILVGGTFDLELELSDSVSRDKIICIRAEVLVLNE